MNLNTNVNAFFWPLIIRGIGMGLLFIPLTTITVYALDNRDIPQGTALSNMVRQIAGSIGIAMMTTLLSTRAVFHYNRLSDNISAFSQSTFERMNAYTGLFMSKGDNILSAQAKSVAAMQGAVYKQAMVLTYNDVFLIVGIFFVLCIPLLLLFRLKGKNMERVEHKVEMHLAD
jgi:DHA2 family multidrug resistance protein